MTAQEADSKKISATVAGMMAAREPYEDSWREIDRLVAPGMCRLDADFQEAGDVDDGSIVNSTADHAQDTLENGMLAANANPSQPWIAIEPEDPAAAKYKPFREWCDDVAEIMLATAEESRMYEAYQSVFGYAGKFSNSLMWLEESYQTVVRARSLAIGGWWIAKDDNGDVKSVFRRYRTSVGNLVDTFMQKDRSGRPDWSRFSSPVRQAYEGGDYENPVWVAHLVTPNSDFRGSYVRASDKRWKSCYWELGADGGKVENSWAPADGRYLRESGYNMMPGLFFPWHLTGEDIYGIRCPGRTSRGEIRELQHWHVKSGAALDQMVDPSLYGPPWAKTLKVGLLPGQITGVPDTDLQKGGLRKVREVDPRVLEVLDRSERVEQRIERAYYVHLFQLLRGMQDRTRTATEIAALQQENLLQLVGTTTRLNRGLLNPSTHRLFYYSLQQGRLPPIPQEMRGMRLKIKYVSVMAQAMRSIGLGSIDRVLETAVMISQHEPGVWKKVSAQRAIEAIGRAAGAPAVIFRSDEEVAQMEQAERDAAAAQMQGEEIERLAKSAQVLSNTDTQKKSALTDVVNGMAAAAGEAA